MENQCALCSLQEECPPNEFYLYAATPILQQIVTANLQEMGVTFHLKNDLFRVFAEPGVAIKSLSTKLSEAERADVRVSKRRGGALLAASTLDRFKADTETEWFEDALRKDRFTTFFQPIVDTRNASLFAHECFVRLFGERTYEGQEIMQAALSRGSIHVFDSYARRLSIRKAAAQFVPGSKICINFMPSSIYDPVFCMASTRQEMLHTNIRPQEIIFEVVESENVRDIKHLQKICDYYRNAGFGFALDDVGAGSNSLQTICDLKPDYVKIDRTLISRVSEPMIRTAVQKLAEFAQQFDVEVIAEGVETRAVAEVVRELGIYLMQGYFFGRPGMRMSSMNSDLSKLLKELGPSVSPAAPIFSSKS